MTHYHRSKVKCLLTFSSDASTAIFGGLFCTAVKLDSPVSLVRRFAAEVIHTWPKTTITQFQFLPRATTLGNKLGMHWLTWNAVQSYFHDKFVKPKLTNRHFSTPISQTLLHSTRYNNYRPDFLQEIHAPARAAKFSGF